LKSDCVPWKKLAEFQYKNLLRLLAYEERAGDGLAFCDRGIGDSIAFCRDGNVEAPLEAFLLGKNRYDKIFIPDMLPNYKNDACRKETEAKAKSLHQQIYQAYIDLGYSPIRVPISSPEERAQFVLDNLSQSKPKQYYQKCISVYRSIVNKVMGE
jgi:predicted ATPase